MTTRALSLLTFVVLALGSITSPRAVSAAPPAAYKCGAGGRAVKAKELCQCPADKIPARDAADNAVCVPKPPPVATACLADRKGKQVVKIDSTPQGATIFLGDKACGVVGVTPWTGKLAPGPANVILERRSYEPATATLTVIAKGKQPALVVPLVRTNAGTIDVRADADPNVTGAAIFVDDVDKGVLPIVLQLRGGRHEIAIKKPGFETFTQAIDVVDSMTITLVPVLRPAVVAKGKLVIDADVAGAEVWIAGTQRGVTPVVLELAEGTYELEVRKQGATTWKQAVVVTKGQTLIRATLAASMAKPATTGTLIVTSKILGEVLIDGALVGPTPLKKELAAGDYWIKVEAPGYKPWEKRIQLAAGQKLDLIVPFVPVVEVRVASTPTGASVFVDNTRVGVTPITLQLEIGERVIVIERTGFQRHTERVKLGAGAKPKAIDVILKR